MALRPRLLLPFDLLLHCFRGQKTGIYVVDHQVQIMAVKITGGNIDDRQPLKPMTAALRGKVVGDRGYISKALMQRLQQRGFHRLTDIHHTMKNHLLPLVNKLLLRK